MKKKRVIPVINQGSLTGSDEINLISTDPFGSYTGLTKDPMEKPVQDADDL